MVQNRQGRPRISPRRIKRRARQILEVLGFNNCELSIVLTDDEFIAQLNEKYRGVSNPTDVLSFPQQWAKLSGAGLHLLGDVVISTETAQRYAKHMGHNFHYEMGLLLAHGILHLLGYEHEGSRYKARKMKIKEADILKALALEE